MSAIPLETALKEKSRELGFDLCGIAAAVRPDGFDSLRRWLDRGFAGEMDYIPRREAAYEHPSGVLPPVRSVVMLAMNYAVTWTPASEPKLETEGRADEGVHSTGRVASYARGSRDYHDLLRERLKSLADFLHEQRPGCRTRVCVDTAPLLERDFAKLAGLGWFGKNTMLLNKRLGSFFFLAALLTDIELQPDEPHHTSHCGTCTRCLDACPTDAFVEPYVLDARKCISYLTICAISRSRRSCVRRWANGFSVATSVRTSARGIAKHRRRTSRHLWRANNFTPSIWNGSCRWMRRASRPPSRAHRCTAPAEQLCSATRRSRWEIRET